MWSPSFVEPSRVDRALRSSHTPTARVELWSAGRLITSAAPFDTGEVVDDLGSDRLGIGVRRTLSLTVHKSRDWDRWLELPSIEVRPFRGLKVSRTDSVECPLGRFQIRKPDRSRPAEAITWQVEDYYSRVVDSEFRVATRSPAGRTVSLLSWLLRGAGLPAPTVTSTSRHTTKSILMESGKSRHDAIADAAQAISAEVYLDRLGDPQITNRWGRGVPTGSLVGLAETVTSTPRWDRVYNIVSAATSNNDVPPFEPQTAAITWPAHPAFRTRLGTPEYPDDRTYHYTSPHLVDAEQAREAAAAVLPRVSGLAGAYTLTGIPDPRIDAGDTVIIPTLTGTTTAQVASVSHPLTPRERQQVTTMDTAVDE